MPKELLSLELERDNLQQKWGFTIQGGADLSLTAKVASVKVNNINSLMFQLILSFVIFPVHKTKSTFCTIIKKDL